MNSLNQRNVNKSCISDVVSKLRPSGIRKFFDLASTMQGVISLGIGEPDFVTPWDVREAAIYSLEKGQTMYTSNKGLQSLREDIANYYKSEYGLSYNPDKEILITVGVSEGLDISLRAILDPGDEVMMADPCYVAYDACTELANGVPVRIPTYEENDFKIDPADIKKYISGNTKALLIGYPANPTGAVMSKKELQDVAEVAEKNNILVISDEIYEKLVYGVESTCFAALPGMKDRTILLGGFSKTYAMTGWRIGYVLANSAIIDALAKIHQYTILCASIMSQKAAIQALQNNNDQVQLMVDEYNYRRNFMLKGFRDIGLSCFEPKGAFYCFPSIKITDMSSEEFANKLLMEEKIAVVPGSVFGKYGEGYIRCCYAVSLNEIKEALSKIAQFVNRNT